MKIGKVKLEIAGPTALWTRPDTGDTPVSYPVPTYSAVKGIFESILRLRQAEVVPQRAEICSPLQYHSYVTNYGGPLRKTVNIRDGTSFQFFATVLIDVCYRLYAKVIHVDDHHDELRSKGKSHSTNGAHAYTDIFNRRVQRGQCFSIPCLGWREFVPSYVGPFRDGVKVQDDIDINIPSMFKTCFEEHEATEFSPVFYQDVAIRKGVLEYAE